MAEYLRVEWNHNHPDEPVVLLSEVIEGDEVRKVEVYRDGRMDYADGQAATGKTMLAEVPMPPFVEIAAQSEFQPLRIGMEEFQRAFDAARAQHGRQ